jgi:hypothetical protein
VPIACFRTRRCGDYGTITGTLHKGETVMPATFAQGFRNAMSGGGGASPNVSITVAPQIAAMDAVDVQRLFKQNPVEAFYFAGSLAEIRSRESQR